MIVGRTSQAPRSLYAVMTLQFALGGTVVPFITILLRDRGFSFSQISHVLFISSATLLVFPFLWGMLADRFIPINRLFTLLNAAAAVALGLFAIQTGFGGLLLTFTAFYACYHPTLILLNALSFHHLERPQQQFGEVRAWGSLGWIIPSLPILIWLGVASTPALDFVLYLGIGVALATAVAAWCLPHTAPGAATSNVSQLGRLPYWQALGKLLRNANYMVLLASFFLVSASFSLLVYYSPPLLEDAGVARAWIGPAQCIGVVLEIILFRWLPSFINRWNYAATLLFGCLCLTLRQALFAFVDDPWILSGSYLLAGMVIVFYNIGVSILVNHIAGIEVRATAQTLLLFFGSGVGPMFAYWVAGRLAATSGDSLRPVFLFAAVLAALASVTILARGRRLNEWNAEEQPNPEPTSGRG